MRFRVLLRASRNMKRIFAVRCSFRLFRAEPVRVWRVTVDGRSVGYRYSLSETIAPHARVVMQQVPFYPVGEAPFGYTRRRLHREWIAVGGPALDAFEGCIAKKLIAASGKSPRYRKLQCRAASGGSALLSELAGVRSLNDAEGLYVQRFGQAILDRILVLSVE
jgi:hypothetical protein